MSIVATGNQQAAGTLLLTAEPSGFFDLKKIKATNTFTNLNINTVSAGSIVELRQKLGVVTTDFDGTDLDPKLFTAGACRLKFVTPGRFTLQDAAVSDKGELVYKFLVGTGKSADANLAAGVQVAPTLGGGGAGGGRGEGLNTFLFLVK